MLKTWMDLQGTLTKAVGSYLHKVFLEDKTIETKRRVVASRGDSEGEMESYCLMNMLSVLQDKKLQ